MKKMILKEWEDRGIPKVKISFQKEGKGMKEAIVPKDSLDEFITQSRWL